MKTGPGMHGEPHRGATINMLAMRMRMVSARIITTLTTCMHIIRMLRNCATAFHFGILIGPEWIIVLECRPSRTFDFLSAQAHDPPRRFLQPQTRLSPADPPHPIPHHPTIHYWIFRGMAPFLTVFFHTQVRSMTHTVCPAHEPYRNPVDAPRV